MLILRMRQAETALKDGRLDEAFEIARSDEVRAHRRGQELIGRLARALAARGRQHLDADRLTQASADCERAAQLGGTLSEVAELRAALETVVADRREAERRKADAIGAAREHIHNGQLSLGGRRLEGVEDTYRAEALRGEVDARRAEVDAILARAQDAVQREDWQGAVESLARVRELHAANPRLAELTAQVAGHLTERIRAALVQGRLDQARLLIQTARPICGNTVEAAEMEGVLGLLGRAADAVAASQFRRAIEVLQQARAILPQAGWLEQAATEAQRAAEATERLRGGPLGMLMMGSNAGDQTVVLGPRAGQLHGRGNYEPRVDSDDRPRAAHAGPNAPGALPRKLMLYVDGVGSFLLVRDRSVTIGGASGSRQPDVPLLMDSSAGAALIERTDEDYFLSCSRPVLVNNQPTDRKLLVNGDRIALTPKCRVRFEVPNAASTSALLSISGARVPGTDATRVVLMDRSLVIGPGGSAHVRADDLAGQVILHVRDGRLFCNAEQEVTVDGRPMDRQAGLPLDAQVRIGPVSMVIKAA